jgi:hypothetical protein
VLYQYVVEHWWVTCIWYITFLVSWTPSFSWLVVIVLICFILTFKTIGDTWALILAVTKHRQFINQLSEQHLLKEDSDLGFQWISKMCEKWFRQEDPHSGEYCLREDFRQRILSPTEHVLYFACKLRNAILWPLGLIKKKLFTLVDKRVRNVPRFLVARSVYCVGVPWRCVCCTCLSCLSCYDRAEGLQMRVDKIFETAVTSEPDSITQGSYTNLNSQFCKPQSSSIICLFTNLIFNSVDFLACWALRTVKLNFLSRPQRIVRLENNEWGCESSVKP